MISFTKRQDQIIDASLKIINQVGVQYYTIKRLAAEIEVTEGAIYKHFESKDAILESIIRYAQDNVNQTVEDIRQTEGTNLDLLRHVFIERCKHNKDDRSLAAFIGIYNAIRNHLDLKPQANRVIDTMFNEIKRIIQEGQRVGEIRSDIGAESIFRMFVGALNFLLDEWQRSGYEMDLLRQGKVMWADLEIFITKK